MQKRRKEKTKLKCLRVRAYKYVFFSSSYSDRDEMMHVRIFVRALLCRQQTSKQIKTHFLHSIVIESRHSLLHHVALTKFDVYASLREFKKAIILKFQAIQLYIDNVFRIRRFFIR